MKVIITGASKGIGRGIAEHLGRNGIQVGLLARSEQLLEEAAEAISAEGGTAVHALCDLRHADETARAIKTLIDEMDGIDALINNAGLVIRKNVFDLEVEEWRAMIETNLDGLFYATRAVLPRMREQGYGHIINISSISGKVPLACGSGYAATKFGVTGFSQSLFHELRDYGIRVTTIYPGSVDSASHRHNPNDNPTWKVKPEEVGQACLDILRTPPGTVISELEIRPLRRPGK